MRILGTLAVALLALTLSACGGGSDGSPPIQPQYNPEIVNLTDSFQFQLTDVVDGDGSLNYSWTNTGTAATIDRSSSIDAGSVTVTLRDASNAQVYQGPLQGVSGSVSTPTGTAGTWTIVVDFANATGTINFRVQKL